MEKTEQTKSIQVSEKTHQELMLFKIKSKARNLEEVMQIVIKKLKEELKNEKSN